MRYGYIMQYMTQGAEEIIKEKMARLGCGTVFMESAQNGYRRTSWKVLNEMIKTGDEFVCYNISHLATDDKMVRELKGLLQRKQLTLLTMEGLREQDGLVELNIRLLDEIIAYQSGSRKRLMGVIVGLRSHVQELFPNVNRSIQKKIYAALCLAQGIDEGELYQATGKYGAEATDRIKKWLREGEPGLSRTEKKLFEAEYHQRQKEAQLR